MRKQNSMAAFLLPLLAVAIAGCGKDEAPKISPGDIPTFLEKAEDVGLKFTHFTGATGDFYLPEIMGAGAALVDYDNDGDLDIYLIQGTTLNPKLKSSETLFPPPPDWKPGNRLFRNELVKGGELRFTDITELAGVGHIGYGMGVAVGDYDNDGFQDLYVTNFGPNVLFHNNGNGTFTDVTRSEGVGIDDPRWSTSAAFLDYDRDGHLDLYVANYLDFTIRGNKKCFAATGERDFCTPQIYNPVPDRLFHNLGHNPGPNQRGGRFEDAGERTGISSKVGPGLGVVAADFNGDDTTDIYVANDGTANHLWLYGKNGTFREDALISGTGYNLRGMPQGGMGVSAGDIDLDGKTDLLVTNLTQEGAVLYHNEGGGTFYDATAEFGLLQPTYQFTGFGAEWFDYDNDGHLDLYIANGAVNLIESLRGNPYPFHQMNQLFRYEGPGKGFRETTDKAGAALAHSEVSRGAAFGDIDNDGDLDVLVTNNNGPVRLLLNQAGSRSHWLQVRLETSQANRFALGARVGVSLPQGKTLWRRVHTDSSYLSAGDSRVHFGLGNHSQPVNVTVRWPDGKTELWDAVPIDTFTTLRQGTGRQPQP